MIKIRLGMYLKHIFQKKEKKQKENVIEILKKTTP